MKILNGNLIPDPVRANKIAASGICIAVTADDSILHMVDLSLGSGALIFGHCDKEIVESLQAQATLGSVGPASHGLIEEYSYLLKDILNERFEYSVLCNSGSEATQRALRFARAFSSKDLIIYFSGSWHGINEWTLFESAGRFTDPFQRMPSGIPEQILSSSLCLPFNRESSLDYIRANADRIGGVIIEPIQGSLPSLSGMEFIKNILSICRAKEIPSIFDEVITGFRISKGGFCGHFDLNPDIVTYGKVLGGGLPIGMVSFNEKIAAKTFFSADKLMLTGGTFSANPLTIATSFSNLKKIARADYEKLNEQGETLRRLANQGFADFGIAARLIGFGSMSRLVLTDKNIATCEERDYWEASSSLSKLEIIRRLFRRGYLMNKNFLVFNSFAHSEGDLINIANVLVDVCHV